MMKAGVKLFTDREYVIDEMPEPVRDLPFLRTSIEKTRRGSHKAGHALRAHADDPPQSGEPGGSADRRAGFTKVDVPEVQLFPGEINRVSLYRKEVKTGERLQFKKMVLLILRTGRGARSAGSECAGGDHESRRGVSG